MGCFLCGDEAVDRCFTCGQLFCAKHGQKNCVQCTSGIAEGDPRVDRITAGGPQTPARPTWWRPQEAEEYTPTACHICTGLTRAICTHCRRPYCAEHAGRKSYCSECHPASTDVATYIVGGFLLVLVCWSVMGWIYSSIWQWWAK